MIFENEDTAINAIPEESLYFQDIIKLVDRLPAKTRDVFHKYAIEGYTHKDIGEELNISAGTSKWHLSEARKRLKELLSDRKIYNSNVK